MSKIVEILYMMITLHLRTREEKEERTMKELE
jgi:hypothetical protein